LVNNQKKKKWLEQWDFLFSHSLLGFNHRRAKAQLIAQSIQILKFPHTMKKCKQKEKRVRS
jgi:hypothetical protein